MSLNLSCCTLTGVDEKTDLEQLIQLSHQFPVSEWGFLYSPKRQGQPGRYPSIPLLQRAFSDLPQDVHAALHICGRGVSDILSGEPIILDLVKQVTQRHGRIQLNFNHTRAPVDLAALADLLDTFPSLTVITQHNLANSSVWEELHGYPNHAMLFDSSGGKGVLPVSQWPEPLPGVSCGYAGGLSSANLAEEMGKIAAKTGRQSTWLDMEGHLRSFDRNGVDWFNLTQCERCLEIVSRHTLRRTTAPN